MPIDKIFSLSLRSEDETTVFARALARDLEPGDTILLGGPIGAGKSFLARALIQARLAARGITDEVPSPTFTLVQTYDDGIAEIWHADLYRLSGGGDLMELGLEDAFSDAICLVEWPDRLGTSAPRDALKLELGTTEVRGERTLTGLGPAELWGSKLESGLNAIRARNDA